MNAATLRNGGYSEVLIFAPVLYLTNSNLFHSLATAQSKMYDSDDSEESLEIEGLPNVDVDDSDDDSLEIEEQVGGFLKRQTTIYIHD